MGDSFTEGLEDARADGSYRGWADRLAAMLTAVNPGLRYGNLAVRGRMMDEILDEQLPIALHVKPDLITICAGGNDVLMPGCDVEAVVAKLDDAVAKLTAAGCEVVLFTGPDTKQTPVLRRVRGKIAVYNCHLWAIASRHGCHIVDLWGMDVLHDRRAWSPDRLHLSPLGHQRVALRVADVLGVPTRQQWNEPWPPASPPTWLSLRRDDLEWTRMHLLPWVRRQLRGESTGDGLSAKRPSLEALEQENVAGPENVEALDGVNRPDGVNGLDGVSGRDGVDGLDGVETLDTRDGLQNVAKLDVPESREVRDHRSDHHRADH